MEYDLIIKNGYIVDGTGKLPFYGDVAVKDGRIVAIGELYSYMGEQIWDAKGRMVSPGLIDAHAHSENSIIKHPDAIHKISQGITAEITGHCGDSCFPCKAPTGQGSYSDLSSYRKFVLTQGMSIDQVSMIGHGNLREWVLGEGALRADKESIAKMRTLLEQEFQAGAVGMSSGLEYAPGMYSDITEMVPLASLCKAYHRVYSTHMRSEGSKLLEAVEEALTVAKESGAVTVLSHIKACGKSNHGKVKEVIQRMKEANAKGANVYGDCYPYDAGCTGLTIVLPQWTLEKGNQELLRILASSEGREKIREWFSYGIDVWENRSILTGWENIFVSHVTKEDHRDFVGKSIQEISRVWKKDEIDTLMDLLLQEEGYVPGILRSACEEDVRTAYQYDRIMVCSDSVDVEGSPHPRLYGSHTRFLSKFADLSTGEGIAKSIFRMTGLPAQVYGLHEVGSIELGKRANLMIWNPEEICDKASYAEPQRLSKGVDAVFVGGQLSYQDEEVIPVRAGKFL